MTNRKQRSNPKKLIGLIVLILLAAAAIYLGIRVANLVPLTQAELRSTPTPEPVAGNVMQVTVDPGAPTPEPVLRNGSTGDSVKELQGRLQALGYYNGEVDGQYGSGTAAAVKLFQEQNGLGADGIVGAETRALLYSAQAKPVTLTPTPAPATTPDYAAQAAVAASAEDGMPLLVNRTNPLPDGYQPTALVNMSNYCDASVVKIKEQGIEGEKVAVDALMVMLRAAQAEGITVWQVSAGWRSVATQQGLFDAQVAEYIEKNGLSREKAISATRKTVADPGTSEHHTGMAFDITVPGVSFAGTDQANWLAAHCWEYGFILRYQKAKEDITGFVAEAWHFRYVGVQHSLIMRDEDLCLEEYIAAYGA